MSLDPFALDDVDFGLVDPFALDDTPALATSQAVEVAPAHDSGGEAASQQAPGKQAAPAMMFRNEHLSVSRLKRYEQCALSFFFQYVSKGERAPVGNAAIFGVVLHEALESLFAWVVRQKFSGVLPLDQLTVFYQSAWQSSTLTNVALYQEGLAILRTYARSHPVVDHASILGVEKEFNLNVDGFVLNGYIDRIDRIDDEEIEIIDYKSNRSLFTGDELDSDLQMSVYGLAARELYPWAKRVRFTFHMLRHDEHQGAERTTQVIDDARGYVVALGRRTEDMHQKWEPKLNEYCGWCDHRLRCRAYGEALRGDAPITKAVDLTDIEQVAREREQVKLVANAAYARSKELEKILKARLNQEGEFTAAGHHYRYITPHSTEYDAARVLRVFADVADVLPEDEVRRRAFVVDASKVEELRIEATMRLERDRALLLKASLEAAAKKTPGTPRFDSKAEKKLNGEALPPKRQRRAAAAGTTRTRHGRKEPS